MEIMFDIIGRKSIYSLIFKLLGYFISFIGVLIYTKIFEINDYGEIILIVSWLSILKVFSIIGFDTYLLKKLSTIKDSVDEVIFNINKSLKLTFIATTLIVMLVSVFLESIKIIYHFNLVSLVVFYKMLPSLWLITIVQIFGSVLKVNNHPLMVSLFEDLLTPLIRLFGFIIMVYFIHKSIDAFLVAYYFALTVQALVFLIYYRNLGFLKKSSLNLKNSLKSFSIYFFANALVLMLLNNIDRILLGFLDLPANIVRYNLALNVSSFSSMMLAAVALFFAPLIANAFSSSDILKTKSLYYFTTGLINFVNYFLFSILIIFSNELFDFFGLEFLNLNSIMLILIVGQFFNSTVGLVSTLNFMTGDEYKEFIILLIAVLVNLILGFLFTKFLSVNGMAIAYTFTIILKNILSYALVKAKLKINLLESRVHLLFFATGLVSIITILIKKLLEIDSITYIVFLFLAHAFIYILIVYLIVLNQDEKVKFKSLAFSLFRNKIL